MKKFKLTNLQRSQLRQSIDQRNKIDQSISNLVLLIVDANGEKLDPKGRWLYNEDGTLSVDIIPSYTKTVKEKLKAKKS